LSGSRRIWVDPTDVVLQSELRRAVARHMTAGESRAGSERIGVRRVRSVQD